MAKNLFYEVIPLWPTPPLAHFILVNGIGILFKPEEKGKICTNYTYVFDRMVFDNIHVLHSKNTGFEPRKSIRGIYVKIIGW